MSKIKKLFWLDLLKNYLGLENKEFPTFSDLQGLFIQIVE